MIYAYRNVPRNKRYTDADYALEKTVSSYWLNFIKTGNPNGTDTDGNELPLWQTSAESGGKVLELGESVEMRDEPFLEFYQFYKK